MIAPSTSARRTDRRTKTVLALMASLSTLLLGLIVLFLFKESWPLIAGAKDGAWLNLFGSQGWYPLEGRFGMAPMISASVAVTLGATTLALPFGLGCALFLQFYAPPAIVPIFRLLLSLLAGVPSVVFGLW